MLLNCIVTCACFFRIVCAAVCISISLLCIIIRYQILCICHAIRQFDSSKSNTVVASFSGCLNLIAIFILCITGTACIHRFRAIFRLIIALHENIIVNILSVLTCRQAVFIDRELVISIELVVTILLLGHLVARGTLIYSIHIYKFKLTPAISLIDIALLIRLIIKWLCVVLVFSSNRLKLCFQT